MAAKKEKGMTLREYWKQYGLFKEFMDYEELDFKSIYDYYLRHLLTLVNEIVQIEDLPESVNETFFKYCVFMQGKCTLFRADEIDGGEILGLNGTYSDLPDVYYIPEYMLVNNPRLHKTYRLKRDKECAVIYCREVDKYSAGDFGGLYLLLHKTAVLLADNCISINVAQKNTRLLNLIGADDQQTKESIDAIMAAMYAGKPYKAVQTSLISQLSSVPLQPTAQNRYLVDLIQVEQYILSHFYESIGLSTHDQMKKERLVTSEINDNIDLSLFNIYNIIKTINKGFELFNKLNNRNCRAFLNPLILDQLRKASAAEEDPEAAAEDPAALLDLEPDPAPAAEPEPEEDQEPEKDPQPDPEPEEEAAAEDPEPEPEPEPAAVDIEININQDPEEDPAPSAEPVPEEDQEPEEDPQPDPEPEEEAAAEDPEPEEEAAAEDPEPEPEPEPEPAAVDIEININQDPEEDPAPAAEPEPEEDQEPEEDPQPDPEPEEEAAAEDPEPEPEPAAEEDPKLDLKRALKRLKIAEQWALWPNAKNEKEFKNALNELFELVKGGE